MLAAAARPNWVADDAEVEVLADPEADERRLPVDRAEGAMVHHARPSTGSLESLPQRLVVPEVRALGMLEAERDAGLYARPDDLDREVQDLVALGHPCASTVSHMRQAAGAALGANGASGIVADGEGPAWWPHHQGYDLLVSNAAEYLGLHALAKQVGGRAVEHLVLPGIEAELSRAMRHAPRAGKKI